jgi:hypothetical protein
MPAVKNNEQHGIIFAFSMMRGIKDESDRDKKIYSGDGQVLFLQTKKYASMLREIGFE